MGRLTALIAQIFDSPSGPLSRPHAPPPARPRAARPLVGILALEQRLMFDGALASTVAAEHHADVPAAHAAPDPAREAPVVSGREAEHPAAEAPKKEIVFVDTTLQDWQSLVRDIPAGAEVVMFDPTRNGVDQMAQALSGRTDIDAIHIVSHGGDGYLVLGNTMLSSVNLGAYQADMSVIRASLSADGDILLYGCDVAKGSDGVAFVRQLAAATGADVAASTNDTGVHGDWELEFATGVVNTPSMNDPQYQYDLATIEVTNVNDSGAGSLRAAITTATGNNAADTIVFDPSLFSAGARTITLTSGALDVSGSSNTDAFTIIGPGADLLTISGNNASAIFAATSHNTSPLSLSGMKLTAGYNAGYNSGGFGYGGGAIVSQYSGNLTLDHVIVTNSVSYAGGGGLLFLEAGATLTITNSTFSNNSTNATGASGQGGGISAYSRNGNIAISNSTISGNTNHGIYGGGASLGAQGSLVLTNVTISGNTAGYSGMPSGGGGGLMLTTPGTITNCTIANNAFVGGNAINNGGGGLSIFNIGSVGTVTLKNSIITNNTSTNTNFSDENVIVTHTGNISGSNNIIGTAVGLHYTASNTMTSTTIGFTGTLGALAYNGGSVKTLSISSNSNAVSAGIASGAPTTDARGYQRGVSIDIGAFEYSDNTTFNFSGTNFPSTGSIDVPSNSNLNLDFGQAVTAVTGFNVVIKKTSDNSVFETIDAADARITIGTGFGGASSRVTVNPTGTFASNTGYYVVIDSGAFKDGSNRTFTGIASTTLWAFTSIAVVDVTAPTATVAVASSSIKAGQTSGVTFTFSEAVTNFTNADLTIANGTLTAVSSSDGGITWTATFTPTAGLTDATNVIAVNMAGLTDLASNAGVGTTNSNNYAIDTVRPTASVAVSDNSLTVGETSLVTITFSEAVTGFTNADLTIANGTLTAVSSGDGGITWTATLTPTASTTDATNVVTLANTGVTNAAGNAGSGTTDSNNYAIDTARPTAGIVMADNSLTVGETSLVTITFSEAVTGFANADLTIANGALTAVGSSDGGTTWTATFTPTASLTDATNVITLDNTGVTDAAGNAGSGTTDSNNYAIDTVRPTASIVVADTALTVGETSLVTITFSEAVTGFTNADLTIANGTLTAVSSSDGGTTWTATLTPTASLVDATNVITLANTGVADAAGNAGTGTTDSNNYAVDTTRPTAGLVVADNSLTVGETSLVTITFSEAVTGFTNADLTIANGTLTAVSSSDGGTTWTATLTPTASTTDATNLITLDNTGVTDAAGNAGSGTTDSNNYAIDTARPTASVVVADTSLTAGETSLVTITFNEAVTGFTNADLTIANGTLTAVSSGDGGVTWTATLTPTASLADATNLITLDNTGVADAAGNAGSGTTDSNNYAIATVRPTASIVVADTALAAGETSLVTITFSEAVTGFTNADLTIANGTLTAVGSSDGGTTWTATLTPTASLTDATNVITLANTGIANAAGNAGTGTTDSNNYAIDTARPTAGLVVADNSLTVGETSLVTITFSEAVTGFTNADLTVANGTLSTVSSSDGGITWTATLTPTASLADATNVITLANTGVADAAGNAGSGTTDSNNYAVDTARPTAGIVVADNSLTVGETSLVTITFGEAVTGFTNADLTIANGTLSSVSSSDGGITWTATLTPTASLTDATNLITLDNTGVADAAGNAGTGTTDSNNYAVDTARPTAGIVVADTSLAAGETSLVTITFSEAVTGFTNADLTVANGTLSAVGSSDGGVTWTATFTPTASLTDTTNVITLANTGVADAAGNTGTGTTDSNNYAIDTARPTAGIVVADNSLTVGETSLVTITFSEAVIGFTNADLTIANGTLSAVSSSDGGITWTATLTPTASTADTTNLITLSNTGVADASGNTGTGTTDSNNYAIDTARPTASIVVADTGLTTGETSLVTITFSEAVTGFTNADLTIANGTLSAVSSSDGGITWTATLTPTASLTDPTNVVTLANTGVADTAGNAGTGTTDSNNYAIDTNAPTATIVVADTALAAGETSLVTITFSEAVTGFTNADLTIANGTLTSVSSGDGGVTWTATLTPAASTTDATNLITLDNTGFVNGASNPGVGTTTSNNYAIDTARPTAGIVVADTSLSVGETSLVTIAFSEAVTGFTNADLTIANGSLSAVSSSDGGTTWTATFTPTASLADATNLITLANTGVADAAGNAGTGTTDSNNYAIDTARPTASIAVADNALSVGETSLVTITFSEAVTGFTNVDLTVANGTLTAVSSSDGGVTWTATLTPTASATDASNVITLANTGVIDAAGNAGTGTTDSNNYAIDTARPTAGIVVADTSLTVGETSLVTITFSEAVTGFTNADLTIANGTLTAVSSGDGGVTWTATLTPTASTTDTTNLITLANTGVADASGNAGTGTTDSNNYAVDTIRPTAGIVVADTALAAGETSLVTITFSEAVTGFTNGDLTIANGTLSAVSSGDGGITWTATLTPTAGLADTTNLITLANAGVADAAGNAGTGTTDSNNYAIDTARPTASIVVADSTLTAGETSLVTIAFSEAVTGFTNADLTIANGALTGVASSDGGITWTATFTPTAGLADTSNLITLDNTGVSDAAGNAGVGTTNSNNYAIATMRPTASIVVADTSLTVGETSLVTITFSEAVTGFTNADLTLANGTLSAVSSSDGGVTWTATFTPTVAVTDASNVIALDNTGVINAAGNTGTGTTDSNNYAVDTARPTASIAVADTALTVGETSLVTITFSEAVTGFTNADLTIANGTLSAVGSSDGGVTWTATLTPGPGTTDATNVVTLANTGVADGAGNTGTGTTDSNNYAIDTARPTASIAVADTSLTAGETSLVTITFSEAVTGFTNADVTVFNGSLSTVASSDGGITWTATLTPTVGVTETTNVITLANTGVVDATGNAGTGTTASNHYAVDTARPTASVVVADAALTAGESSQVTITFSEAVTGFTNADLTIANGTLSAVSSSDAGITWTATLTPSASVADTSNILRLDNTGVVDSAGNTGTGTTDSNNYTIDTAQPTANVAVADTSLTVGETSLVTITFSEAVTGFTNADLTVANGRLSAVTSSDGGITWTATLIPTANTADATNLITLDNSGVADAAGNAGTGTTGSNNYAVDTAVPTATIVLPPDGTYVAGQNLDFTLNLSEAVVVDTTGGTPRIAVTLDTGGTVYANYLSGSGSASLVFRLTVAAGQLDSDGIRVAASPELGGATIRDAAGNDATFLPSGTSAGVKVDAIAPQVTSVSGPADGHYNAGDVLSFTVAFSETLTLDTTGGAPRLAVDVGGTAVSASYVSRSDSGALLFQYTVQPGDNGGDGITVTALQPHGAVLADAAGNALDVSLHGVAGTTGVVIDTTAPVPAGIELMDASPTDANGVRFTVTFSEAVTGLDANAFSLVKDGTVNAVILSVTQVDARTYTVLVGPLGGAGKLGLELKSTATGIADAAGNALVGGATSAAYEIRTAAPVPQPPAPPPPAEAAKPPSAEAPPPAAPAVTLAPLAPITEVNAPTLAPRAEPALQAGMVASRPASESIVADRPAPPSPSPAPVAEARGAFIDVGSAASGAGLRSVPDIGDFSVRAGTPVSITLPSSTFTHSDKDARITVEVRQTNGLPLPSWLKFDPATGTISGQPPKNVTQRLSIEIIARDNKGARATSHVDVEVKSEPAQPPQRSPAEPRPQSGLSPELTEAEVEAGPRDVAGFLVMEPVIGRAGLNAQFDQHGLPARQAERAALLEHLQAAARFAA